MRRDRRPCSVTVGSSSTAWNQPLASSSSVELAAFSRSRLLGVKMTSGRCLSVSACLRSRWKYWAAVEQLATRMLSSAASCRKRSMRPRAVLGTVALVAVRQQDRQPRGLAPLGASRDDELVDHDLGAVGEVAVLGLPEHQRLLGARRVAVLEAERRRLRERAVVQLEAGLGVAQVRHRGVGTPGVRASRSRPSPTSCSSRWRWLKVPRPTSWPVSRIGTPSWVSSDAKASDSACAQAMPPSVPIAWRRRSSCGLSLGWTVKLSGTVISCSLRSQQHVCGHRGLDRGPAALARGMSRCSSCSAAVTARCASVMRCSAAAIMSSNCCSVISALLDQLAAEDLRHRRVGLDGAAS